MPLPTNLNTNEVKSAGGVELEFTRAGALPSNPNSMSFIDATAPPALSKLLYVAHEFSGSGLSLIRRSVCSVERTIVGQYDATKFCKIRFYTVGIIPVGNMSSISQATEVAANLNSFMATTGAATTVLFDGTGYGTAALLSGSN